MAPIVSGSLLVSASQAPTPANPVRAPLAQKASPCSGATRSEEHTSELQSLMRISYAVFCLKKKTNKKTSPNIASQVWTTQLTTLVLDHHHEITHITNQFTKS